MVAYYVNPRIVHIKPFGYLPIKGDEMDFANPRGKFLYASKPIFQETIISKSGFRYTIFGIILIVAIFIKFFLPFRIVHIDPCNHEINVHIFYRASVIKNNFTFLGRRV